MDEKIEQTLNEWLEGFYDSEKTAPNPVTHRCSYEVMGTHGDTIPNSNLSIVSPEYPRKLAKKFYNWRGYSCPYAVRGRIL
jgi:hypothetical protein